jgi:hypothetical protein
MPIIFISGVNKNKILTRNKNKPTTTRQKTNMAIKNTILNTISIIFFLSFKFILSYYGDNFNMSRFLLILAKNY